MRSPGLPNAHLTALGRLRAPPALEIETPAFHGFLFGDQIHNISTVMISTISDFFSSAPTTSQLHTPLEVQRADDFASTITTASTKTTFNSASYEDVD
jgi:hypothetical protein